MVSHQVSEHTRFKLKVPFFYLGKWREYLYMQFFSFLKKNIKY